MKISFRAFSFTARLSILFVLLSATCGMAFARHSQLIWHQTVDKRPRADKAWAIAKRDVLEVKVEHLNGISKTQFVLKEGKWPPKLQFEFRRFKALEGFKVWTDSNKFEGSIAYSNKQPMIDLGQGFTAKKRRNAIFIYAPDRFIRAMDKSIHVEWVDFYRQ
jgi:hypothetical protein